MCIIGSKYYVPITISGNRINNTFTNKRVVYPLKTITDYRWWGEVSSAANIAVIDSTTGTKCNAIVSGDIANKQGCIYFDTSLTSGTSKTFELVSGAELSETNSTDVYISENIFAAYHFNEPDNTIIDYAGNYNGTAANIYRYQYAALLSTKDTIWLNNGNGNVNLGTITQVKNASTFTISGVTAEAVKWLEHYYFVANISGSVRFTMYNYTDRRTYIEYNDGTNVYRYYFDNYTTVMPAGVYHCWTVVFDGSLTLADRIKLYVNGNRITLTPPADFPTTLPNVDGTTYIGYPTNTYYGFFDDVVMSTDSKSYQWHQIENSMFREYTNTWTTGSVVPVKSKHRMRLQLKNRGL